MAPPDGQGVPVGIYSYLGLSSLNAGEGLDRTKRTCLGAGTALYADRSGAA